MAPLLIVRPEPGASATLRAAHAMGPEAHAFPLFAVHPLDWEPVAPDTFDALLLGSANVLRHGGPDLARYRGKPAYAVGGTTAKAARDAGFDVVATGRGGLQSMLAQLNADHRHLLRLAGREHVSLTLPDGVTMTTREVYASDPLPFPDALTALLAKPAVVLLHSGEAASHFAQCCDRAGIDRGQITLAAIGPRVAARAGTGWADLRSASEPSDAALLAMASQMCQDTARKFP
jgi:uroporphyrinogen-III synthase